MVSSASRGLSSTSNISTTFKSSMIFFSSGQGKIERCTLVHLSFRPDAATMTLDDPLHDCQPNTGSFEFIFAVQALEHAKQLVHILDVKTCAVIADTIDQLTVAALHSHFDHSPFPLGRKLDRIGKQIDPHLVDERRIAYC